MKLVTTHSMTLTSDVNSGPTREMRIDSSADTLNRAMRGPFRRFRLIEGSKQ